MNYLDAVQNYGMYEKHMRFFFATKYSLERIAKRTLHEWKGDAMKMRRQLVAQRLRQKWN